MAYLSADNGVCTEMTDRQICIYNDGCAVWSEAQVWGIGSDGILLEWDGRKTGEQYAVWSGVRV